MLPDEFQGVNVLEDVFENWISSGSSWMGDGSESVHAKDHNQNTHLKEGTAASVYELPQVSIKLQKVNFACLCVWWFFVEKLCVSDFFSNVKYQDLCATINLSRLKIKDLEDQKQSLKHFVLFSEQLISLR